jgi:hypothetical protein
MDETVIEIVEISNTLPLKHQLGKVLVATVVAFAATKLSEKSYDAVLGKLNSRKIQVDTQV